MKLDDGNFLCVKNLASLHECFRAHGERMMHALIYAGRLVHGLLALAQQDVVVAYVEAGHDRIAEPA